MNHGGVGRMLVASLHQGISDLMPTRLDFYENWLHPSGLRDGKIGLAPLTAVLSFLRQEGDPYDRVTERAGQYAGQWVFDSLSPFQQSFMKKLPRWLRVRMAARLTKRVIRGTFESGRATSKLRKGGGTLTLQHSVFCAVREPTHRPLCGYYAAALSRLLALLAVPGSVEVSSCQGAGAQSCVLTFNTSAEQP